MRSTLALSLIHIFETIKQQEQENYKLLTLSYKQVREFKHDIENQFLVLNDMLENNDTCLLYTSRCV